MKHPQTSAMPLTQHLPSLDGLRGIAALWVLLFHTQLLTGLAPVPLLSYGGLAVDLFILLSGMLMTHHYLLRQASEPWESPRTWSVFWVRRFFRIAPVYYVVLATALCMGPLLGQYRELLELTWPQAATHAARYSDHSMTNILSHITFVFGLLPTYSFNTPLPDWSIGLEMQFYAVFPFLMLLVRRLGLHWAMLLVVVGSAVLCLLFAPFFERFELPSILPMKLYMFACGILIAISRQKGPMLRSLLLAVSFAAMVYARHPSPESAARIALIVTVFYLLHNGTLPSYPKLERVLEWMRRKLGGRVGHFLGEMSYSVYLVHLLVLIPVSAVLLGYEQYAQAPSIIRYSICLLITVPMIYSLAALLHVTVEQPGIHYGKRVAAALRKWKPAGQRFATAHYATTRRLASVRPLR